MCRYEWVNRGCVCLSVRVGVVTLRADLCVEEGEGAQGEGMSERQEVMERWMDEPTTDLSCRVGVAQLAAGGAEICRGFPHLALLLFLLHCLLKHTEKEEVVKQTDKTHTRQG